MIYLDFCIRASHGFLGRAKFFTLSEQALTAIIPKTTAIPVAAPPHINTEEVRINLQLQKEREKNEFYMKSIWSLCVLGDLVSSDHRWHLTIPLL